MKRSFLLVLLVPGILGCLLTGCAKSVNVAARDGAGKSDVKNAAARADDNKPTFADLPHTNKKYPLPVEAVAEMHDPARYFRWAIDYTGYDNSQPPRWLNLGLFYEVQDGRVDVGGHVRYEPTGYGYQLQSVQPFEDLVRYMADHPEVFFTYSEFEGEPPGEVGLISSGGEALSLSAYPLYEIAPAINQDVVLCTAVDATLNEDTPEEIRYVVETLKSEFMEELFRHPRARVPLPGAEE